MKPIDILLIEDNAADVRLTREALKEVKLSNTLNVVSDGEAALDYLHKRGDHADAKVPDLVLLDLNLPRVGGHEVLEDVKGHEKLRRIPVVVLTSSDAEGDIVRSYDNYANCYVQKPVDMDGFIKIVSELEGFWFSIVKLPPK